MDNLLAARLLMAISLGFHIIFASISMVLPFYMVGAYITGLRTGDSEYLRLTKFWLRGVAILFAVGAVSGTILSFELGLLWPEFMKHAGPIIGMPFSLEGAAFFIEAIAIGIFLYGWGKIPTKLHVFFGILVGVSGVASGILVVAANGWMNSPSGFEFVNGEFLNIDPIAAMLNPAWFSQALHMTLAAFQATGLAVMGIHASLLLKNRSSTLHRKALLIALIPTIIVSFLMPVSGDIAAKSVAKRQPVKLAAMEAHFETMSGAPLIIGGIPNEETGEVKYALKIPKLLSFLATNNPDAVVLGLNDFDRSVWPPVKIVHFAFQIMVGIGSLVLGLAIVAIGLIWFRGEWLFSKRALIVMVLLTPLGFIALESGWVVTEVGRQPWIIYGIMKTKDAVTPVPGMVVYLAIFSCVYVTLAITVSWMMRRQFISSTKNSPEMLDD